MTNNEVLALHKLRKGNRAVIIEVPEGKRKSQLIRLGLVKGELVHCMERLPGGTIVIKKNRREIAIGAALAKSILVKNLDGNEPDSKHPKK